MASFEGLPQEVSAGVPSDVVDVPARALGGDGFAGTDGVSPLVGSYNPLKSRIPICTAEEWAAVETLVREVVARLPGLEDRGVRPYLTSVTRLAVWVFREGLPVEVEVVLSSQMIEAHVASLPSSRATVRSALRRVAAMNGVATEGPAAGYSRPKYSQPYSSEEFWALLRFALALSNAHRRRQLVAFLLLGAGCGFSRGDLRGISAADVHCHDDVQFVFSSGRCAPVLPMLAEPFAEFLSWCGDGPLLMAAPTGNVTDRMVSWVGERAGVPKLSGDRLRAFYVCELLSSGMPLLQVMSFAGLATAGSLDQYLEFIVQPPRACDLFAVGDS